ncbi:hypothetical protein P7C73_g1868, partial [Tremellales sp. Uapishka_1]
MSMLSLTRPTPPHQLSAGAFSHNGGGSAFSPSESQMKEIVSLRSLEWLQDGISKMDDQQRSRLANDYGFSESNLLEFASQRPSEALMTLRSWLTKKSEPEFKMTADALQSEFGVKLIDGDDESDRDPPPDNERLLPASYLAGPVVRKGLPSASELVTFPSAGGTSNKSFNDGLNLPSKSFTKHPNAYVSEDPTRGKLSASFLSRSLGDAPLPPSDLPNELDGYSGLSMNTRGRVSLSSCQVRPPADPSSQVLPRSWTGSGGIDATTSAASRISEIRETTTTKPNGTIIHSVVTRYKPV